MTEGSDYGLELEKKLNDLNKKVEQLKTKLNVLEEQKTREFYEHLEEFNAQQKELKIKLQQLDTLESEAQTELKSYLEQSFQYLRENLEIRLAPYVEEN